MFASGAKRIWTYDSASQVVSLIDQDGGGSTLQSLTFAYDAGGNRTTIVDSNGATTLYEYDSKNRLTSDTTPGTNAHTYNYGHDANDNRLTSNEGGTTMTATYDAANCLVTSVDGTGTTTYTFDANGNQTKVQTHSDVTTLSYDKENRLSVHQNGAVVTSYTYSVRREAA